MNILITGGTGLTGKSIVKYLNDLSHKSYIITRNRSYQVDDNDIKVLHHDIRQPLNISIKHPIDAMIHFGAYVPLIETESDFSVCYKVNTLGTLNILKWCVENNVQKVVYASCCAVYGSEAESYFPIDENQPINCDTPYSISKYSGELLCNVFSSQFGIDITIFRLGYIYGTGMNPQNEIKKLIKKLLNNEIIELYNGNSTLNLVHRDDVAKATYLAIKGPNGCFNLVSDEKVTLCKLVTTLRQLINSTSKIHEYNSRVSPQNIYSINKLISFFDWKPEIYLEEGIKDIIEEVKNE
jgi:UDP-glucose 4-epimerase